MRGDGYAMKFGEKLQKLRKENGLSQEQLAEKLNVSRQAISKWEMGTIPDMENVVKIGRYFDCSLDYLMNNELDSKRKQDEQIQKTDVIHRDTISKELSIGCIEIGIILSCLMPLFAKLYQGFELKKFNECFTNPSDYIFRFPLLEVFLLALLFLVVGIVSLFLIFRDREKSKRKSNETDSNLTI